MIVTLKNFWKVKRFKQLIHTFYHFLVYLITNEPLPSQSIRARPGRLRNNDSSQLFRNSYFSSFSSFAVKKPKFHAPYCRYIYIETTPHPYDHVMDVGIAMKIMKTVYKIILANLMQDHHNKFSREIDSQLHNHRIQDITVMLIKIRH